MDVVRYFESQRQRVLAGHSLLVATSLHAAIPPGIEVLDRVPAAFRKLWRRDQVVRVSHSSRDRAHLSQAMATLEKVGVLERVTDVTHSILLFHGNRNNSFYHPRAHGTIFIRLSRAQDDLHLVEETIHQAGHAAFAALMLEPARFLRAPIQQRIQTLTFEGEDNRSVGVALHGLVTEALVAETLQRAYSKTTARTERHRLAGRLAFATAKLAADLQAFIEHAEILGTEGLVLLKAAAITYQNIWRRHGAALRRVSLSRQPYVFSQNRYLAVNPIHPHPRAIESARRLP